MDDKATGRILKLVIYCSVGQVALVAITATTLGVFVRDHVRISYFFGYRSFLFLLILQ